jgi:cyclin B
MNKNNKDDKSKEEKNLKNKSIDLMRTRGKNSYRQFGQDITNFNQTQIINNEKNGLQVNQKKQTLSRKGSTSSRKVAKIIDIHTKKRLRGVPEMNMDNSAKNLKKEINNNSFGGSSMILDEPIMTRNQITEKLFKNDPQLALEYVEDILCNFYKTESNPNNQMFYPYANYMRLNQRDINDQMRVILFDWIVDVHQKWKLLPDTLFLTFNIIDRFLGVKATPRDELQCVGVGALLVACKYEEIYFPEITDFQEITDNAFSKYEIIKKEFDILGYLQYDLTVPSSLRFFEVFNVYLKIEGRDRAAILFLLELCSFDYGMIKYKPSLVATGCIMLIVCYNPKLKDMLFFISKYSNEEIEYFIKDLYQLYYTKPDHGSRAIKRKYSHAKFFEVAKMNIIDEYLFKKNNINDQSGFNMQTQEN